MKHIFKHWKTSLGAVLVAAFTVLVFLKTITVQEWVIAMGAIGTFAGFAAKDFDKVKDND